MDLLLKSSLRTSYQNQNQISGNTMPLHFLLAVKYHAYVILCRLQNWDRSVVLKKMYVLLCDDFLAIDKFCWRWRGPEVAPHTRLAASTEGRTWEGWEPMTTNTDSIIYTPSLHCLFCCLATRLIMHTKRPTQMSNIVINSAKNVFLCDANTLYMKCCLCETSMWA